MTLPDGPVSSSFRDPSGYVFRHEGRIYRHIAPSYRKHYERFMVSGLYKELSEQGWLVSHEEVSDPRGGSSGAYKIIRPFAIPFISYPHEWCFSALKDAALVTLRIQKAALAQEMTLKDANAFNIQFIGAKAVLADTLSFEIYEEGAPWRAYKQFCEFFLAPLLLMRHRDARLAQLFRAFLDGVPLNLASRLLPKRTYLDFSVLTHVHLHAQSHRAYANRPARKKGRVSRAGMLGLIDSLESAVNGLRLKQQKTEWADYYDRTNYTPKSFTRKKEIVSEFLKGIQPKSVWDLGANTGVFSRIAAEQGASVVSFDFDSAAVDLNYREAAKTGGKNLLPLVMDLTNPTSGFGWEGSERMSFFERGHADCVLALALAHHLAIGRNIPLERIARFFSRIGNSLIVEFVPKTDSQLRQMLASREDIFPDYDENGFLRAFSAYFRVKKRETLESGERILFLMERLNPIA